MKLLAAISLMCIIIGCSKSHEPQAGDLCTIDDGEGSYGLVKVLVVDDLGVHVKVYKNKWKQRPETVDTTRLSLGGINDKDGFGMEHLPLGKRTFAEWKPVVIGHQEVLKEELDGYEMWKDGGGGYFGDE